MRCDIRTDIIKNRLYLILEGFFSDEDIREAADKIIEAIDRLMPGFDVINDVSNFKPATRQGATEIARGQKHAETKGVNRIVRVAGKAVLGSMQFERVGRHTYDHTNALLVSSIEEAERFLDGEPPIDGEKRW